MRIGLREDQLAKIIDNHFADSQMLSKEHTKKLLTDLIMKNNEQLMSDLSKALDSIAKDKQRRSFS